MRGEQSGLLTRIATTESVCVVQADEKLTAFVELEGGDSVFVGGLKIDHPWPQCDAHGLMMKLEIRSTGNSGFGD